MNRYTASGLIGDAQAGKDILVLARHGAATHAVFDDLVEQAGPVCVIRRANGAERIDFPSGGRIRFVDRLDGHLADILYVDHSIDASCHPFMSSALRLDGELIRA